MSKDSVTRMPSVFRNRLSKYEGRRSVMAALMAKAKITAPIKRPIPKMMVYIHQMICANNSMMWVKPPFLN